jgi:hypothetical protein
VPAPVLALAGALAAAAYGRFGLGMSLSPPFVMTALGGMTLVLTALALWRVLDPLTNADAVGPVDKRAPLRLRELEREKQAVLKAIKEIELDYQMRKISEPDYREMVERYRARALRVMGDLAAGDDYRALIEHELKGRLAVIRATAAATAAALDDGASPPLPAAAMPVSAAVEDAPVHAMVARACGTCATPNDADARFCKRCGAALAVVGPAASPGAGAPK